MWIGMGGTISGEHGIGIEKRSMMPELFAADDLAVMGRLSAAVNPDRTLNPGKILPGGGGCREGGPASAGAPGDHDGVTAGSEVAHAGGRPAPVGGMRVRDDVEGPWT